MGNLWRYLTKLTQESDQATAKVRDAYLRLDVQERSDFRQWVERLVQVGDPPDGLANTGAVINVGVDGSDEPETVSVCPRLLSMAIAAWDSGDEYAPEWANQF